MELSELRVFLRVAAERFLQGVMQNVRRRMCPANASAALHVDARGHLLAGSHFAHFQVADVRDELAVFLRASPRSGLADDFAMSRPARRLAVKRSAVEITITSLSWPTS
jgi:hypothetical protein